MYSDERVGGMPIFLGALRPKLLLEMDARILGIAVLSFIGVIFSLWMLLVCATFVIFGRIAGARSPYLLDDLSVYLKWRAFSWNGTVPDDVFISNDEPKFVKEFRATK